ncbi:molybdate ABC transporter substrate-binding protein [Lysinibacter sp. HNR]|uniref:molybdate ABC transporter substrate-binding protein n=1 Tax=Lysinibacter sp. HNR TaxID=3031408 RepID=UPI002434BDF5|nr:molybdate ABC transporter substrate-binding protein [Lysinibacter sp. HNR]WGD36565.1 molybdate ABC transporter substrate-binding protein [Lysinibacter sp. HNR]
MRLITGAILTRVIIAAALVLPLAACSPRAAQDSDSGSHSEENVKLTVFAAASLRDVFDELTEAFSVHNPNITFAPSTFDGSSALLAQIAEGAPADIFAAADARTMSNASDRGLLNNGSLPAGEALVFATNILTLVVPPDNPGGVTSLADLSRDTVRTVLCAPEVPCGSASNTLLDRQGVVVSPVSQELSVTAVLTKVAMGEADAGLVYVTDARAAGDTVRQIEITGAESVVNEYPASVVAASSHPEEAAEFIRFLESTEASRIFESHGFGVPGVPETR